MTSTGLNPGCDALARCLSDGHPQRDNVEAGWLLPVNSRAGLLAVCGRRVHVLRKTLQRYFARAG
jgi:hypothetical protein